MADPIGLVGLVASVLQLVNTVAQIRGYIKDFRDAPKDQWQLLLEIESLEPLVEELEERIKRNQAAGMTSGLQQFEQPLFQLKGMMGRLMKRLNSTGISKVSNQVVWPLWGKEDVEEGLNTIERFKSLLTAWLGMDIWKSAQDITSLIQDFTEEQRIDHSYIMKSVKDLAQEHRVAHNQTITNIQDATEEQRTDHNYIAKSVRNVARSQEQYHDAEERDEIIEWFSPLNFFLRQADIFNARQPGTGRWLLEDDLFAAWKSGTGKILWCVGMPGAGKTVLASIVVDNLRTNAGSMSTGVAVLYLNHKETGAQSPSNLLAGLWRQLVLEKPLSSAVHQLYRKHREPRTRPSLEEIHGALRSTISQYSEVFLVVDALDEYPEEQRDVLLRKLFTLGSTVNLLLTSRPHINIDNIIGSADIENLEIRATEDDVRQYIEAQILKSSRLSKHIKNCPDLRNKIERRIVGRSDGMFLLAKLYIDSLTTKHTVKAVREALDKMPSDLTGAYDELMERINRQSEDDKDIAQRTLSWVSNAKRLLHIVELREALAVEHGATKLDPDTLLDPEIIISVCAGLVIVNEEDDLVRLIHYTAQDYMDHIQATAFPHASTEITMTCITYLSFTVFSQKIQIRYPDNFFHRKCFLDYAVEYCLIHARGQPELRIKDTILAFLTSSSRWREFWNDRHRDEEIPESTGGLWITAVFGLDEICRHLIKKGGAGAVLQKAALEGRTDVVRILIGNGADTDADEGEYDSPLQAASVRGHEDVIGLLLDHGANVNVRGHRYGTALQVAAYFGHGQCVNLLIQARADINIEAGVYGTALHAASSRGNHDLVRLLIQKGAEVSLMSGVHTPLHAASTGGRGYIQVARILIEQGADVNARAGGDDSTALQAASWAGYRSVAKFLIENGANINATGGPYGSALQAATWWGCDAIVKLLLEHGADVNVEGGPYGCALQLASFRGFGSIARLLIEHGADIKAYGVQYGSALYAASRYGHNDIANLLIENGADVNAQNHQYGSALRAASLAGYKDIVSLLIEHGAHVNAQGRGYDSALQAASRAGHKDIVGMLVEHGADVNAQGGQHGSALHAASKAGHKEIVSLLIKHGANVDAQ
ncbi:ankyrin repeat-containing domain protein [Mycena latifolia]|nr:ankyrin repeat-containing domain protein [Mycena latifolia]